MLNNFLFFSVPWDSWDDDVSCEWPHLCKKKVYTVDNAFKKWKIEWTEILGLM